MVFISLLFIFPLISSGNSQIPTVCIQNATKANAICCPAGPGSTLPCGGPDRGVCSEISVPEADKQYDTSKLKDDRLEWPYHYFHFTCRCNSPFHGVACQECRFGRRGSNCSEVSNHVRKNILEMTDGELAKVKRAFQLAKQTPMREYSVVTTSPSDPKHPRFDTVSIFDYFSFLHYHVAKVPTFDNVDSCLRLKLWALRGGRTDLINGAHNGPAFITWHRHYLLQLEREMQKLLNDTDFALPYWSWIGKRKQCEICTNRYMGATDRTTEEGFLSEDSEFSSWDTICHDYFELSANCKWCDVRKRTGRITRNPGRNPDAPFLPPVEDLAYALSFPRYDSWPYDELSGASSFRILLEGLTSKDDPLGLNAPYMHGQVHFFMNGTVSAPVPPSADDPLFFLIHSFVDLLFELWFRHYQPDPNEFPIEGARIGHNQKSNIISFIPPVKNEEMFIDSRKLGYDYDSLEFSNFINLAAVQTRDVPPVEDTLVVVAAAENNAPQRKVPWSIVAGIGIVVSLTVAVSILAYRYRSYRRRNTMRNPELRPLLQNGSH